MTREGTRLFAVLVAAVLAAALLVACGSSDSGSTASTASTGGGSTTAESRAEVKAKLKERIEELKKKREAEGKSVPSQPHSPGGESASQESGGGAAKNVATPLKVSGGGSEQFRTKGGDNSIQEFGDEGSESELQEVAEVVHSFYVARAEEKWDTACSYLAKSNVEQLEQLAAQSPQLTGSDCGPILKAFTRPLPAAVQREITTVDAGSFRREGEQGFLIYYGAEHATYAMPLREEGGSWKVAALSGTTLG